MLKVSHGHDLVQGRNRKRLLEVPRVHADYGRDRASASIASRGEHVRSQLLMRNQRIVHNNERTFNLLNYLDFIDVDGYNEVYINRFG